MRNKDLMQDDGQAGGVLLIIVILVILFLIVHFWGWGSIEHFVGFIMKHLPVLTRY